MWWASIGADEVRLAWHDSRRAPGWLTVGAIAVFWPVSGFSLLPVTVAVGAWVALMMSTRGIWRWRTRRAVRRLGRRAIGVLALAVLAWEAGLWGWLLAVGLWLIGAGLTDQWRARERLLSWLVDRVAATVREDPERFDVVAADWAGTRLVAAEVEYGTGIRAEEPAVRDKVAAAISWALRHEGRYRVNWPAGTTRLEISADPPLPRSVDEQDFGDVPGIPIGVTDEEHAHGFVDSIDPDSGDLVTSLPIAMVNPADAQKHYMVIGGTGAGKSVWMRGFIARALRMKFFPGGVFILDGKSGSDFVVFEGREGVHCVARDPEEWSKAIREIVSLMRSRYDEDAEYQRGNRSKPAMPRYLVVIDEIQVIREILGKADFDPFLQQISRQMRASEGRLMIATQRPDTDDSMPGPVRDMLEERIVLGFVSPEGARMAFGKDWRVLVDDYGASSVPGRGMARVGGTILRLQGFHLRSIREHPEVERYYPPKVGQDAADAAERAGTPRARWAPPTATPDPPPGVPAGVGESQPDAANGETEKADRTTTDGADTPPRGDQGGAAPRRPRTTV
ncbi:FtsK/SpoIIIE family protein [Actinokineospora terrae]|uniref:FtsK/SpoIIIE family protein n=2 Tax=Actinokineospora terrae TaxID=155974 RepID=A0A1H9M857_9PSEU|nr:FtsK/SpoIIIE family protein [Actinokineospora terrae]